MGIPSVVLFAGMEQRRLAALMRPKSLGSIPSPATTIAALLFLVMAWASPASAQLERLGALCSSAGTVQGMARTFDFSTATLSGGVCTVTGGGGGAPTGASYWTRVAEAGLSAETALGLLGTGIILNTTGTGVPVIYAGSTPCAGGNFVTQIDPSGVTTCAAAAGGGTVTTTGSPANGNLTKFSGATSITNGNLSGDITTTDTLVTTLVNIPTATPAAGSIIQTNIAAPGSPAAGKVSIFSDSTDLRFHDKNASGVIGTTVVADAGASNNFLTAISVSGGISKAQPGFTNLSGSLACGQTPALTGDVTTSAGSCATTVVNLPSGTTMAGSLLATAIVAPGTPAAGKGSIYVDSTSKNLAVKDDAGVVKHGIQTDTGASNNFLTSVSDAGLIGKAQPAFTNLSGSLACGQAPALTGDVTTSAGSCATTVVNLPTGTTMAGYLAATAIAAPATPGAGLGRIYVDSTSKNLAVKDDAGVVKHGIQSLTCSGSDFVNAVSDAGGITCGTPAGSGTVTTTGSPATGNLTKFSGSTSITNGDLSGDVTTAGTLTATLANIPTAVPMAGYLAATAIAAPATPAAGLGRIYVDSTSKNLAVKDDAGVVKHGIQTLTCSGSDFVNAVSDAGGITCGTPAGSGTVTTTGSPASGNLTKFSGATSITNGDLAGDVTTAGALTTTLVNIPSGVTMAGSLLATTIVAPGTPAAGKGSIYVDSTSKNLAVKDDAGVVKHGVQTDTGASNNFFTAVSDAGLISKAQPAFTNISGIATPAQLSAPVNDQSGTTYTVVDGDRGKLVTHTNAGAVAVTLPDPGGSFISGWYYDTQNRGAGTVTITRGTSSTIDGATSIAMTTDQGLRIFSDGTNYFTQRGRSTGGAGTVTTTGSPASGNLTKFSGATSITNGNLSGDVTTTDTLAATIANDAVTYAKMQNVSAASRVIGRGSAGGSGDPEELTTGTGMKIAGTVLSTVLDIQTYTSGTPTWTKPTGASVVIVIGCGAGGGGGGGSGAAAGSARTGGGGAGGGFCSKQQFAATDLTGTVAVTVGAGGTAGTGGTSGSGTDGGVGNNSSFGTYVTWYGGGGGAGNSAGAAGGSGAGCSGAGVQATNTSGVAGGPCLLAGISAGATNSDTERGAPSTNTAAGGVVGNASARGGGSGAGSTTAGATSALAGGTSMRSGGAGGMGGGVNVASPGTEQSGTAGGQSGNSVTATSGGGGAGGAAGSACGSGGDGVAGTAGTTTSGGYGGGGGASRNALTGCAGGAGGLGGGGGAGGGGGTSTGGPGGIGGAGYVYVISW